MFSKGPSFFVILFVIIKFEFSPAPGEPASARDHVMTSQHYTNFNMTVIVFLILVLQISNSSDLKVFSFSLHFLSSRLQGPSSIVAFEGSLFRGVVWIKLEMYLYFFVGKLQTVFFRNSCFRISFIFSTFCWQ